MSADNKTKQVKDWWNTNPYTYGLSKKSGPYRDVGDIPTNELDIHFFDKYMRKCRKLFDDAQTADQPLASRFIDYDFIKNKKVLDIACGFGWSTVEMLRAGAMVIGIDITSRAVEVAKKHLELLGLEGDVQNMDGQDLKFSDQTFNYVLAWGCLMHMPKTEQAIAEIYRVLKPGGKTAGYMYNRNSIAFWWNRWLVRGVFQGKLFKYKFDFNKLNSRYSDGATFGGNPLAKVYTPKQATKLFKDAGFVNVEFKPWGPPLNLIAFPFRKIPLGRFVSYKWRKAIASRYGYGMIFTAEKPNT